MQKKIDYLEEIFNFFIGNKFLMFFLRTILSIILIFDINH